MSQYTGTKDWAEKNGFSTTVKNGRVTYVAKDASTKMPELNEYGDYVLPGLDYSVSEGGVMRGYTGSTGTTEASWRGGSGYGAAFEGPAAPPAAAPAPTPAPTPVPTPTPPTPGPAGTPTEIPQAPSQQPLTIMARPRTEAPSSMGDERSPELETSLTSRVLPASGRALQQLAAQRGGRIY